MNDLDRFTTLMDSIGATATAANPFYLKGDDIGIEVLNMDAGNCMTYTPLFVFNKDGSFKGVGVII